MLSHLLKDACPTRPHRPGGNWSAKRSAACTGYRFFADQQSELFSLSTHVHRHVEGTGMGLYIVRRIVENSGGAIALESQEGKGTTFRVVPQG